MAAAAIQDESSSVGNGHSANAAGHVPLKAAFGILLIILQTVLSLYGITLQRLGHVRKTEVEHGLVDISTLSWRRRPRVMWWLGLSLFLGSQILMPFALALAPMSLLAPLSCVQIFINLLMAHFILKEEIKRRDIIATCCSGVFAIGVLIFGPTETDENITYVTDIISQMTGWGLGVMCFTIVFSMIMAVFYVWRVQWERSKYLIIPWLHTSLATFGMIFTKGLGTQLIKLKDDIGEGDVGEPLWQLAITAACIIATSPTSCYFQVKATAEFDNRWFIPVKFALMVVLQLFLGAAAFNEWEGLPAWRILVFLAFSFCCIGAVLGVSSKNSLQEKLDAQKEENELKKSGGSEKDTTSVCIQMGSRAIGRESTGDGMSSTDMSEDSQGENSPLSPKTPRSPIRLRSPRGRANNHNHNHNHQRPAAAAAVAASPTARLRQALDNVV